MNSEILGTPMNPPPTPRLNQQLNFLPYICLRENRLPWVLWPLGSCGVLFVEFCFMYWLTELLFNLTSYRQTSACSRQRWKKIEFLSYCITRWLLLCLISPFCMKIVTHSCLYVLPKEETSTSSHIHIHNRRRWLEPRRHQIGFFSSFFSSGRHTCQSPTSPNASLAVSGGPYQQLNAPSTKAWGRQ